MKDLLVGYSGNNLSDWVSVWANQTINGVANSSTVVIDIDGAGPGTVKQYIQLEGVNLNTDVSALVANDTFKVL